MEPLLIAGLVECENPDTDDETYYWTDYARQIARAVR